MPRSFSFLRSVAEKLIARDQVRAGRFGRPRAVPRLETLEPRLVMTAAVWDAGSNTLTITGDASSPDTIVVSTNGSNEVTVSDGGAVTITNGPVQSSAVDRIFADGQGGTDSIDLSQVTLARGFTSDLNGNIRLLGTASAETLTGSQFNDVLQGNGGTDTLDGGGGNDALDGGVGYSAEAALNVLGGTIVEVSGTIISRQYSNVMWSIQDGGDTRLWAHERDGDALGFHTLNTVPVARDFEDIAHYNDGGTNYLYIGDIGDSDSSGSALVEGTVRIYRVQEPSQPVTNANHGNYSTNLGWVDLTYTFVDANPGSAGGNNVDHTNFETLLVDPIDGRIYLVSREESDPTHIFARLYQASSIPSATDWTTNHPSVSLTDLGEISLVDDNGLGISDQQGPRGGDISADGMSIVVMTESTPRYYSRALNQSIADVLVGTGRRQPDLTLDVESHKREGVSFDANGDIYTTAEDSGGGTSRPVHRYSIQEAVDSLLGGDGADFLMGRGSADVLTGGTGADSMHGGSGDDTFEGGSDNDSLVGGAGNDTYRYSGGGVLGTDSIHEVADVDTDTLDISGLSVGYGASVNIGTTSTQNLTFGGLYLTLSSTTGLENVIGTSHADNITGNSRANSILGGSGNDTITAGSGNDSIDGGAGDDSMSGETGDDTYLFTSGALQVDEIIEAAGSYGGDAGDMIDLSGMSMGYGATLDLGYGGTAQNVFSNGVRIKLSNGTAIEKARGTSHGDSLTGNSRRNTLWGGEGNDTLHGMDDDDELYGEGGDDLGYGGNGTDILDGGSGTNQMHQ